MMMTFSNRRKLGIALTVAASVLTGLILLSRSLALRQTAFHSGWLLASVILFLSSYQLRKKLTYPPLLRSATWLQLHIYAGAFSIVIFAFHIGWRFPSGAFETILATMYAIVVVSGIIGLIMSRTAPVRISQDGEEVIFERIPLLRAKLRDRAEKLIVKSVEATNATTLSDFYAQRLADFFRGPRQTLAHLAQSNRPRHHLLSELKAQRRYLDDSERAIADELARLIEQKVGLDHDYAMQGALKLWLFVHIPATYLLLLMSVVHVALVHAFLGGAP